MKMEFNAPKNPGKYPLKLYFICDSYLGADQEYDIQLRVEDARSRKRRGEDDAEEPSSRRRKEEEKDTRKRRHED